MYKRLSHLLNDKSISRNTKIETYDQVLLWEKPNSDNVELYYEIKFLLEIQRETVNNIMAYILDIDINFEEIYLNSIINNKFLSKENTKNFKQLIETKQDWILKIDTYIWNWKSISNRTFSIHLDNTNKYYFRDLTAVIEEIDKTCIEARTIMNNIFNKNYSEEDIKNQLKCTIEFQN